MSVLVTGGTGFVGIHLVRVLAAAGRTVVAFDANPPDALARRFLGVVAERVAYVRGDVRDREALRRALEERGVEAMVHAAAITANTVEAEAARFAETVEVNVLGTVAALEAVRGRAIRRILHVSSSSIYGGTEGVLPVPETAPANPLGLYPSSKWAGEQLARRYGKIHGLPLVVVRLTLPFGPLERDSGSRAMLSPFPQWLRAARAGEELAVPGLETGRDYTYAEDVARGIMAVLEAPRLSFDTYNISNGVHYTVAEILEALRQHFPRLRHRVVPPEPEGIGKPSFQIRADRGPLDPTRLFMDCGYRPHFDLKAGLARYREWLDEAGG